MSRSFRFVALLLVVCAGANAGESPTRLRSGMAKAGKDYIDLYNKTNTDPQFEIICRNEKPTGTNFSTRICRPRYVLDAMQASASDTVRRAVASSATAGAANPAGPMSVHCRAAAKRTARRTRTQPSTKNVLEAQNRNPELLALGKKRDELQKQLEAASKN